MRGGCRPHRNQPGSPGAWLSSGPEAHDYVHRKHRPFIQELGDQHNEFLMVDGKGYGLYAKSQVGGPPECLCGLGILNTVGTVVSGDEQKYPNTYAPGQLTYSRCREYVVDESCCNGGAKRFHDAVGEGVTSQRGALPYGALTNNCSSWAAGVIAKAKDKACPSSWLKPSTWGNVKLE
jgi:hypothetical protein